MIQSLESRFLTREENWRNKRKTVREREDRTATSTLSCVASAWYRRVRTSKVGSRQNWSDSKKSTELGGGGEVRGLLATVPGPHRIFCPHPSFQAARMWTKLFVRKGTLATQASSTYTLIMCDARSDAWTYPTLKRYNNSLTWSIFSVLSPDLIAYLCWMYFARINSFLSSLKKIKFAHNSAASKINRKSEYLTETRA